MKLKAEHLEYIGGRNEVGGTFLSKMGRHSFRGWTGNRLPASQALMSTPTFEG